MGKILLTQDQNASKSMIIILLALLTNVYFIIFMVLALTIAYMYMSRKGFTKKNTLYGLYVEHRVVAWFIIIFISTSMLVTLLAILFTRFEKRITIKDKFIKRISSKGGQDYFIVDSQNNSYILGDTIWLWEFNKTDDYNIFEKGKTYTIKGYWFRSQFFSQYPIIYNVKSDA